MIEYFYWPSEQVGCQVGKVFIMGWNMRYFGHICGFVSENNDGPPHIEYLGSASIVVSYEY